MTVLARIFFFYKHRYNHLHINELLYKFQSGFPPGYSTTYLLIELYDDILLALDKKKITKDTSIGNTAHNEEHLCILISTDLEYLNAWSCRWFVKFNPNKTDIMTF